MAKTGKIATRKIYDERNIPNENMFNVVLQASCALAQNDTRLVSHLQCQFPEIGSLLDVANAETVIVVEPVEFHKTAMTHTNSYLQAETQLQHSPNTKPKGGRVAQIDRFTQLWARFARKTVT